MFCSDLHIIFEKRKENSFEKVDLLNYLPLPKYPGLNPVLSIGVGVGHDSLNSLEVAYAGLVQTLDPGYSEEALEEGVEDVITILLTWRGSTVWEAIK